MSYEEISAELDQKFTELGQNFGRVRPKIGPELGVKFWKKNPAVAPGDILRENEKKKIRYCQKLGSNPGNSTGYTRRRAILALAPAPGVYPAPCTQPAA